MRTSVDRGAAKATLTVTAAQVEQAASVGADDLAALPTELAGVLRTALDVIARGGTVTIGSIPHEVTTTTAAEMLDVSRPTLMKLVKDGALPAHKVGSHTRLLARDVFDYREQQRRQQLAALADLRAFEDELGREY